MPGVKGRTGQHGRQGRKHTSIRNLATTAPELHFDRPVTAEADVSLGWCVQCGAVWWESFGVTYRQGQPNQEADANGDFFPIVAVETRARQPEQHYKWCSLYKKPI